MPSMRPLTLAVIAAAISTPTLAEDKDYIYINPFAAFQYFDDKRDLSETGTFGAGLEYRFTPSWAVEAVYSRANADRKYNPGDSDFEEIRLDGLYYFGAPEESWNPYLAIGAGNADFGDSSLPIYTAGTNHDETRVNVGGGVRYNISEMVSLRGDIREFHGIDESTFDTQVSLGLSLAFGWASGQSEPAVAAVVDSDNDGIEDGMDQCQNTPAGAAVDGQGCELDDDRDGVANSADQCPATPAGASVDGRGCETDSDNDGVVDSKDECPDTAAGAEVDAKGCEGIAETVETFQIEVQFPTNSAAIDDSYDAQIQQVASFMSENPETIVEIAGHTDSAGNDDYNQALSQRRAEAVARRLTENLGVEAERVSAVGYGEAEPVADNGTAAGRAQNRRVEARIQVRR